MLKCVYAHTGFSAQYPSYLNVSATGDETCGIDITVRGHAEVEHTENGTHLMPGHSSETHISQEQAMELARAIVHHYHPDMIFAYPIPKPGEDGIGHEARARFFPDDHMPGETHRVYEETDTVGDISQTRRLIIDSVSNPPLQEQVVKLAAFIMSNFEGEPSGDLNEGAIDVAIRLLGDHAALLHVKKLHEDERERHATDKIAVGLRSGQGEHILGETAGTTLSTSFVDAGTKAAPLDYFDMEAHAIPPAPEPHIVEAAHADGTNEPAVISAPLYSPPTELWPAPGGGLVSADVLADPNSLYDAITFEEAPMPAPLPTEKRFFADERGYDVVTPQPAPEPVALPAPGDDEIPF